MKVSVCLLSCNHIRWIEQAISSVLDQRVDFEYEIVVGDDASDDGSWERLLALAASHPGTIRVSRRASRLGLLGNVQATLNECRGEYVAHLDSDDYWTDRDKLAMQIALLDADPACSLCFHQTEVETPDGQRCSEPYTSLDIPDSIGFRELLEDNPIATSSAVWRRARLPRLPDWFLDCPLADWPLYLVLARDGTLRYIRRSMAVYRLHPGGFWSGRSEIEQKKLLLKFFRFVGRELDWIPGGPLRRVIAERSCRLATLHARRGERREAWKLLVNAGLVSRGRVLPGEAFGAALRELRRAPSS